MFQHLLVPLDFTEKNDAALAVAQELALRQASEVTLLHVVETVNHVSFDEFHTFYRALEERAHHQLVPKAEGLSRLGIEAGEKVLLGKRVETIVRFAEEAGCDLIVMSSHRVDPESPGRDWGSISYKVAILSQCPVLLVK